jgi:hypothetical protein
MPRGWVWLWVAAAVVVGQVLGILLTVVSVIRPLSAQRARQEAPSAFLQGFSPRPMIELAGAVTVESFTEEIDREPRGNRPWGRTFTATVRLGPAQESLFASQVQDRFLMALYASGAHVGSSGSVSTGSIGPARREHRYIQYDRGGKTGAVHLWTIGHGDGVLVLISLHER